MKTNEEILKEVLPIIYPNSPDPLKYATDDIKKALLIAMDKARTESEIELKRIEDILQKTIVMYEKKLAMEKSKTRKEVFDELIKILDNSCLEFNKTLHLSRDKHVCYNRKELKKKLSGEATAERTGKKEVE